MNPFPVPKVFNCPICSRVGDLVNLDRYGGVKYVCNSSEKVAVGGIFAILNRRHTFVMKWEDKWVLDSKINQESIGNEGYKVI